MFYPPSSKYVRSLPLSTPPPRRSFSLIPNFFRSTTPPSLIQSRSASIASSESDFDPSVILLPGELRYSVVGLSEGYRTALGLASLTALHLFLITLTTIILLYTLPSLPPIDDFIPSALMKKLIEGGGDNIGREHPSERAVRMWATTMGLSSVILGCAQYAPQIMLTAQTRLVGSLSIPMMFLQVSFRAFESLHYLAGVRVKVRTLIDLMV